MGGLIKLPLHSPASHHLHPVSALHSPFCPPLSHLHSSSFHIVSLNSMNSTWSAKRFCIIFSVILNNVIWSNKRKLKITYSQRHFIEIMHIFVVISVPADGLAPFGARTSAGTVMTKFGLIIYMGPALEGWNYQHINTYTLQVISIFKYLILTWWHRAITWNIIQLKQFTPLIHLK